ncbi:MAG: TIGR00730 family Rossman fold protein [Immundisolibacteraceae bacterium]|nr:TIGR00730 family Rossman fold protein [Immundisolibacteraceae bacterium]
MNDGNDPRMDGQTGAKQGSKAGLEGGVYRPADANIDYLDGDEARGIRLLLDYQKADSLMRQHGVDQTIVVFGGARILEPAVAQLQLDQRRRQLVTDPDDAALQQAVAHAERILDKSGYYTVARELGHLVGQAQSDDASPSLTLMTGGGPGIMEAANRGAADVGARTVGLNITLPQEQNPNAYLTPGLCFEFHYFATRKMHFLLRAKALVVFPGGFGTIDELFDALTLIQTEKIDPLPVVLVGESFWKQALNIPFLVDEGVISSKDLELFWYAETAEDIWQTIQNWYQEKGEPVIK